MYMNICLRWEKEWLKFVSVSNEHKMFFCELLPRHSNIPMEHYTHRERKEREREGEKEKISARTKYAHDIW